MTVWIKRGVMGDLTIPMQKGLGRVIQLYEGNGLDFYITCIRDGNHSPKSLHYIGNAVDFRGHEEFSSFQIREVLGKDFDVVPERTHIHVEYDPD